MTQHLPPSLLQLFAPRPPLPFLPPVEKKNTETYFGVSQYYQLFEEACRNSINEEIKPIENKKQIKERKAKERAKRDEEKIAKLLKIWDPHNNSKATHDAYKTLFVSRISFETTEKTLKKEFESYGPVKRVRLIKDNEGKSRGYAFIEFEREKDMKTAYKQADGKKIDGKRVLVDVERGRTVRGWRPRRLGGGLGATRAGGDDVNQKWSGREPPQIAPEKSGDRGGYNYNRNNRNQDRDKGERDYRDRDRDRGDRERRDYKDYDRERRDFGDEVDGDRRKYHNREGFRS